jgi:hypothetical protein
MESLYTLRIFETRAVILSFIVGWGNPKCLVIVEPSYAKVSVCHLFGKPMFVFLVECSSHAVLG